MDKENNEIASDVKHIVKSILKRDFQGLKGLAIKNSVYQLATTFSGKLGGMIFMVILARLLLPDIFGLYSLTLSTILIFSAFSDLGIGQAIIVFISKELHKKDGGNVKGYYNYLLKFKIYLTLATCLVLMASAYFISNFYYHKPIFLALLAGGLYIACTTFLGFFMCVLQGENKFKPMFQREVVFQIARLIIVPLTILLTLKYFSTEIFLLITVIALSLSYLITTLYIWLKQTEMSGGSEITKEEKKKVNSFILTMSVFTVGGVFFTYVDVFILGRYVEPSIIGFYQIALTLSISASILLNLGGVFLPLFSRMEGAKLKKALKKVYSLTLISSIFCMILVIILARPAISILYGHEYISATIILQILSFFVITEPLSAISNSYYMSTGKQKIILKLFLISAVLNVILCYCFIMYFIRYSSMWGAIGAAIATLITRTIYCILLYVYRNK